MPQGARLLLSTANTLITMDLMPNPGMDYLRDAAQRWILFLDALRQRADDMVDHERAGKPPLLDFDYETLVDAIRRIGDAIRTWRRWRDARQEHMFAMAYGSARVPSDQPEKGKQ